MFGYSVFGKSIKSSCMVCMNACIWNASVSCLFWHWFFEQNFGSIFRQWQIQLLYKVKISTLINVKWWICEWEWPKNALKVVIKITDWWCVIRVCVAKQTERRKKETEKRNGMNGSSLIDQYHIRLNISSVYQCNQFKRHIGWYFRRFISFRRIFNFVYNTQQIGADTKRH